MKTTKATWPLDGPACAQAGRVWNATARPEPTFDGPGSCHCGRIPHAAACGGASSGVPFLLFNFVLVVLFVAPTLCVLGLERLQ